MYLADSEINNCSSTNGPRDSRSAQGRRRTALVNRGFELVGCSWAAGPRSRAEKGGERHRRVSSSRNVFFCSSHGGTTTSPGAPSTMYKEDVVHLVCTCEGIRDSRGAEKTDRGGRPHMTNEDHTLRSCVSESHATCILQLAKIVAPADFASIEISRRDCRPRAPRFPPGCVDGDSWRMKCRR